MAPRSTPEQPIKPIETRYKGYRFRSRLEARWAVFLDAIGVQAWEYEPQGFTFDGVCYLPDFYIHPPPHLGPDDAAWLEIKPTVPADEELEKLVRVADRGPRRAFLIAGQPWPGEHTVYAYAGDPPGSDCGRGQLTLREAPGDPLVMSGGITLFGCPRPGMSLMDAFQTARSARFEHGEVPR